MKALVPYTFRTGETFDPERVNGNLQAIADDIADNQAQRYTYSTARFDLDGLQDTDTAAARSFYPAILNGSGTAEIVGVELVIYATSSVAWTVESDKSGWVEFSVTGGGSTTKASGTYAGPPVLFDQSAGEYLRVAADGTSTITRGYLVVHFRSDRGSQGTAMTAYSPARFNAETDDTATNLSDEWDSIATAVASDGARDEDTRVSVFTLRDAAAGDYSTLPQYKWYIPSSAQSILGIYVGAVGTNTYTVKFELVDQASTVQFTITVTCTGTSNHVLDYDDAQADQSLDDPDDSADDWTLRATITGGTVELAYCMVIWDY